MKKSILYACTAILAVFLSSCTPSFNGKENPDTGKQNGNQTEGKKENTSSGISYTTPVLPENVGTDPFKGNSYIKGDTKYEFCDNGILNEYYKRDDNFEILAEYKYTYNSNTGILSARYNRLGYDNKLYTLSEFMEYAFGEEADANFEDEEEKKYFYDLYLNNYKYLFEHSFTMKAVLDDDNSLSLQTEFYKEIPSFDELKAGNIHFTNSNIEFSFGAADFYGTDFLGYIELRFGQFSSFDITEITSNKITAYTDEYDEEHNKTGNTIPLTLSYTINTPVDGILSITITGADDSSKELLKAETESSLESYTLKTKGPETFVKVSE